MEKWNWVLSADMNGKWITTNGFAKLQLTEQTIEADLIYDEASPIYHHIKGEIEDGFAQVVVTSPGRDVKPFSLSGPFYNDPSNKTFVLTDGSTILGITYGPESGERNL